MKAISIVIILLIIVGGINWGLVGFFNYNLVDALFGAGSIISRVIYSLVGVAALWKLVSLVVRATRTTA